MRFKSVNLKIDTEGDGKISPFAEYKRPSKQVISPSILKRHKN